MSHELPEEAPKSYRRLLGEYSIESVYASIALRLNRDVSDMAHMTSDELFELALRRKQMRDEALHRALQRLIQKPEQDTGQDTVS